MAAAGHRKVRLGFLCWSVLVTTAFSDPGQASDADRTLEALCGGDGERTSVHAFARHLFEKGYWAYAAEEFLRFCFVCPDDPRVPEARLLAGACWEKAGRVPEAVSAYRRLAGEFPRSVEGLEAWVRIGELSYRQARFEEARAELERFLEREPPMPWRDRARYRAAWAALRLHAFSLARHEFSALADQPGPYREPAEGIVAVLDRIPHLPYRSPVLAGFLSALVPGAGQFYAGETRDALLSFLVNGALIAATYQAFDREVYGVGGVVGVVAVGFYSGSVYGAVNSAHHANRNRLTGALNVLGKDYEWAGDPGIP